MKVLSNYISEKLKISSKSSINTTKTSVTYLDFYNKIQKYCKSKGWKNVGVGMFERNRRPEFLYDDNFESETAKRLLKDLNLDVTQKLSKMMLIRMLQ